MAREHGTYQIIREVIALNGEPIECKDLTDHVEVSAASIEFIPPTASQEEPGHESMSSESSPRRRSWSARSGAAFRWIHLYISMLGFASLMFFAFTGMTLNHPTWFGAGEQTVRDVEGQIPTDVLSETSSGNDIDKLSVAEWLRNQHHLRGRVSEFAVDEYECMVVFKGPGYSADVFVERETGSYMLTERTTGLMAIMNDLHKGRDSGTQWSWVIDVSAVVMMLISVSGFGLLFYIRRRRTTGLLTAVAGTILMIAVWILWVP